MKLRLTPATMAMTPIPEPPEVTKSPEVLRSRAKPLTGWANFQKYCKVRYCTESINVLFDNKLYLLAVSIPVRMSTEKYFVKVAPDFDFKVVGSASTYFVKYFRGILQCKINVESEFLKEY